MGTVQQVESQAAASSTVNQAAYAAGADKAAAGGKKSRVYGKTIGEPKLSDGAKEYYEELKKKYSNMDFVLVSSDMKEFAKSQAGSYANPNRMVVLIDEEKIERMATDEKYRQQYEAIIANGASKLSQVKKSLGASASSVKTFGMQVNDGGTASFFAVVDKSMAAQRERIAKNRAAKAEQKKVDAKKAKKEKEAERLEQRREEKADSRNETTVTASSVEELVKKVQDTLYESLCDNLWTEQERQVGSHFDFRF